MAKLLYGLLFCVGVPLFLWQWASHTHVDIPLILPEILVKIAAGAGAILCLWSMLSLILMGKGLPMNAFPPSKFVQKGPYLVFAHPIYVGFSVMVYAVSAHFQSSSGFYLVAPVVTLGMVALAMGYENFDMLRRFVFLRYEPLVGLVEKTKEYPDYKDKIRFVMTMYLVTLFLLMQAIGQNNGMLPNNFFAILLYVVAVPASVYFIKSYASLRVMGLRIFLISSAIGLMCSPFMLVFIFFVALFAPQLLAYTHRFLTMMANSWHAWHFGKLRIINHGFYAGAAASLGFIIWDILTPKEATGPIFMLCLLGLFVAGIWGQILEGSGRLKRPFGYFGALLGGLIGMFAIMAWDNTHIWEIYGASTIAVCCAQGLGRFRCLVNGCCHGAIAPAWAGICVWHPQSRVSKISSLAQKPVYPSQIYSCVILLVSGAVLLCMWNKQAPFSMMVGVYLVLNGLGRFLEEATRGEVQTKTFAGLKIYQWLAILMLIIGVLITCLDSPRSPASADMGLILEHMPFSLGIAFFFTFAFGIDFPNSGRRFSEL